MSDPISLLYELMERNAVTIGDGGVIVGYDQGVLNTILAELDEPNIVKSVN